MRKLESLSNRANEQDRGNFSSFTIIMDPLTEESFGGGKYQTLHGGMGGY